MAFTTSSQIKVLYNAVSIAANGNTPILGYQLWRDDGNNGEFVSLYGVDNVLALTHIDYLVEKGTIYRYRYRARNINGWGDFS